MTGNIGVPSSGVKSIKLNGKLVWNAGKHLETAVPFTQISPDRIGFKAASGEWDFVAEY